MKTLITACTLLLGLSLATQAQTSPAAMADPVEAAWQITRYKPVLAVNHEPAICQPIMDAVKQTHSASVPMNPDYLDLNALLPSAKATRYPEGVPKPGSMGGLRGFYGRHFSHKLDWDGDGDLEVLHIQGEDIGWRYVGVSGWLFETPERHTAFMASFEEDARDHGSVSDGHPGIARGEIARVASWAPAGSVTLLETEGRILTFSRMGAPRSGATTLSVVQINTPDGVAKTLCDIKLKPDRDTYAALLETEPYMLGLKDYYGDSKKASSGSCVGTMGWTARPLDAHFDTLFNRPQLTDFQFRWPFNETRSPQTDTARELRLMSWAVRDPQSWHDYTAFKAARADFIARLERYYQSTFPERDATEMAQKGWRFMIDRVIYGRSNHAWPSYSNFYAPGLPTEIAPEATPKDVVRLAVTALLTAHREKPRKRYGTYRLWNDATHAALYAGLPLSDISALADLRRKAALADLARRNSADNANTLPEAIRNETLQPLRDGDLLAALGSHAHMKWALKAGANPDARTNAFGKTPLMYAAQRNDLQSVEILLSHGANPNLKTQNERLCHSLTYDQRTALTYAAENASRDLIEHLITAGADPAHRDSKGRTIADYFALNSVVKSPDDRAAIAALLKLE